MPRSSETESEKQIPSRIRLTRPHGFVEEDTGRNRYWHAGEVIKDPGEIALLIGRGAQYEAVDG